MANPERLSKTAERIVEDFCWVQWDGHTQRLYYLTHKVTHTRDLHYYTYEDTAYTYFYPYMYPDSYSQVSLLVEHIGVNKC